MTYASIGLLMLLGAIWGTSFLFIKVGVSEMGPITFATLRVLVASIVLLLVLRAKKQRLPRDIQTWKHFAVMGATGILIPFAAIAWGTQYIASGLSAILNATMPLFTFVFAVACGGERATPERILGLAVGFGGVLLLTWPQFQGGLEASLLGELAVVVASLSYAVAIVYARRHLVGQPPLVASFGQVGTALLFFIPLALMEESWSQPLSLAAIGSVLAIGIFGTAVGYIIYYRLLRVIGATGTSLVTYIVPVFGVFWGWVILNERLSWHAFASLGMIFFGLVLTNNLIGRLLERRSRVPAMESQR